MSAPGDPRDLPLSHSPQLSPLPPSLQGLLWGTLKKKQSLPRGFQGGKRQSLEERGVPPLIALLTPASCIPGKVWERFPSSPGVEHIGWFLETCPLSSDSAWTQARMPASLLREECSSSLTNLTAPFSCLTCGEEGRSGALLSDPPRGGVWASCLSLCPSVPMSVKWD